LAKGWTSPAILMLKTVVDPTISSLSVSLFLFMTNVAYSLFGATFPAVAAAFHIQTKTNVNLDETITPRYFGTLMTMYTALPCALSIPFFLIAGYKMVKIKAERAPKDSFHLK
jgi:hypothetical protein